MERAKVIRGLRIAWSVWWGILCVLSVVLWVRSYWDLRPIVLRNVGLQSQGWRLSSARGQLRFSTLRLKTDPGGGLWVNIPDTRDYKVAISFPGFRKIVSKSGDGVWISYWLPVLLTAATATAPWIRPSRRFSLRTLLLITTVIAVMLGLVVWLT